jgi:hypothetical protein
MRMKEKKRRCGVPDGVRGGALSRPSMRVVWLLRSMVALGTAMAIAYAVVIRPWILTWGSTEEERTRALPGDDLVPNPTHITTHAITIHASTREIWSWLVQMGQDRAGFYTHNWVEKLLLSGIPDIHEIHAEWQELSVGDLMRTNREIRAGHPLGWSVAIVEPDRAMVLRSLSLPQGTYAFVLDPVDRQATRLIARDRAAWSWWQYPFLLLLFEPLHAYMETGVLKGIKQRAERAREVALPSASATR